jgi:light-regulated signal transduction histidine kinase (bacteriophytochrome)
MTRAEIRKEVVNLSALAHSVVAGLREAQPERNIEFRIEEHLQAKADPRLVQVILENLFGNACKFTSKRASACVEFGKQRHNGSSAYFVRDNGAGFDTAYATRLFGAFQRLHAASEFPGTGIGLATVQRIVHRHGGEIWAEGAVERGATFYFTL